MTQSTLERLEAVQTKAIAEVAALEAAQPPADPNKLRLARERLGNIQDAWRDLATAEAWAEGFLPVSDHLTTRIFKQGQA